MKIDKENFDSNKKITVDRKNTNQNVNKFSNGKTLSHKRTKNEKNIQKKYPQNPSKINPNHTDEDDPFSWDSNLGNLECEGIDRDEQLRLLSLRIMMHARMHFGAFGCRKAI